MVVWESAKADFGPWPRFQPPGAGCRTPWVCVRDARPEGRDGGGARERNRSWRRSVARRRWPGAVGHGGIVPYGARSPVPRLGAEHARIPPSIHPLVTSRLHNPRGAASL